jgi:hypothetical protein
MAQKKQNANPVINLIVGEVTDAELLVFVLVFCMHICTRVCTRGSMYVDVCVCMCMYVYVRVVFIYTPFVYIIQFVWRASGTRGNLRV